LNKDVHHAKDLHRDTFELLGKACCVGMASGALAAFNEARALVAFLDTLEIGLEQKTKITFSLGSANVKRFCNSQQMEIK
jgi:hypothetical protein